MIAPIKIGDPLYPNEEFFVDGVRHVGHRLDWNVDYPPSSEELERRMACYRERTRALNASNAEAIWEKAAKIEVEAGGAPKFAKNLDMSGGKFTI